MKMLFVHDYSFEAGGAERLISQERVELARRGHTTEIASLDAPDLYGDAAAWTAPFVDPNSRLKSLALQLHHPRALRAVERVAARFLPDVVHYHSLTRLSPTVLALSRRVPSVLTLHDYATLYPRLAKMCPSEPFCGTGDFACCARHAGAPRYAFERLRTYEHLRQYRHLGGVLVPSRYMEDVARRCGLPHVICCPNGIAAACSVPPATRRRDEILYVGRVEAEKGVLALLAAFELVADASATASLTFAGEGAASSDVSSLAKRSRHAARVFLAGRVRPEDLATRYASCRILAVPSLWPEPFGLVGVEAMRAGTPVVGSGRGGMTDWLEDGRNGLIADPEDAGEFAHAMLRLIDDDDMYTRFSEACRRTAAEFDMSHHVDTLEAIYARVLRPGVSLPSGELV
jgi:glycosyltransferase involved in cell wall biosynthesis